MCLTYVGGYIWLGASARCDWAAPAFSGFSSLTPRAPPCIDWFARHPLATPRLPPSDGWAQSRPPPLQPPSSTVWFDNGRAPGPRPAAWQQNTPRKPTRGGGGCTRTQRAPVLMAPALWRRPPLPRSLKQLRSVRSAPSGKVIATRFHPSPTTLCMAAATRPHVLPQAPSSLWGWPHTVLSNSSTPHCLPLTKGTPRRGA